MNLTGAAINLNRLTILIVAVFVAGGIVSYGTLGQLEDPDFSIKTATVTARWPGATAAEVEEQVVDVLETNIQQLGQLDHIRSEARPGSCTLWVDIKAEYWADRLPQVWDELRRKVQQAQSSLPPEVIGPTVNDDFGQVYGLIYALVGDGFEQRELRDYAEMLRDQILMVQDVARVELLGIQEEQIFVQATASRLTASGIGHESLEALRAQNATTPAGAVDVSRDRVPLFATGTFETVDDIRDAQIPTREGGVVRLGDVAEVVRSYVDPPQRFMRHAAEGVSEGRPCIGLAIAVVPGGNVVTMGEAVKNRLAELEADLPLGIEFHPVADQPAVVDAAVKGFTVSLGQAVAIVLVTLLVGLGMRVGVIVGAQIPLVILAAFIGMAIMGIDLHRISLGALIIALGMLVDNSIVVSDMILTRLKAGEGKLEAATKTFSQAARPLVIATIVSVMGFSPIFFSPESTGEFLGSLFVVVGLALLISWFSAFFITALNCYLFLKAPAVTVGAEAAPESKFFRAYRAIVARILRMRGGFLVALVGLLALSFVGFGLLDKTFFPPATRSQFVVEIQTPEGSRIEETDSRVRALERHLRESDGVTAVTSFVGNGIPRFVLTFEQSMASPTLGQLLVTTRSYKDNAGLIADVREFVANNLPEVDLRIAEIALGPSNNYKVSYRITGPDGTVLRDLAEQVKSLMAAQPGAHEIFDDWRRRVPSHIVEVDQDRARRAGVSSTGVAAALQVLFEGVNVDTFREEIYRLPITIRGRTHDEEVTLRRVMNTPIASSLGPDVTVPLSQVAEVRTDWLDGRLRRRDRIPTIEVQCNANEAEGFTGEGVRQGLDAAIREQITLPPGYTAEWAAEYEDQRDSSAAVMRFLPVAIAIMIVVLTGQFNSYRKVIILFANMPFALIGVTVGLLIFRQPFGFVAMLGLLSLVGMLVNIGIVLMDQIDLNLQAGQAPFDALVNASVARIRAIALSAGTTVLGMIPLVVSDPFWRALGVLIMFGLACGALLTPLVIPVLYSLLFRVPVGGSSPSRAATDSIDTAPPST